MGTTVTGMTKVRRIQGRTTTFAVLLAAISGALLVRSAAMADDMPDYVASGPTASQPAAPFDHSMSAPETALASPTPDYFTAVYPHLLRAPLPVRIYNQGGVPPLLPRLALTGNPYGRLGTFLPGGPIVPARHAFFRALGTNGRACVTCHQPPSGMSFSLRNVNARFRNTRGTDPIFAPVDGANCPDAVPAASTSAAPYGGARGKGKTTLRAAYSLLLGRGVIRVAMPWPPRDNPPPEFTLELLRDAPRCNSRSEFGLPTGLASVYRRPMMSAQLNFKTVRPGGTGPILAGSLMWDGRETSLEQQAIDATLGHAQATHPPSPAEVRQIVDFQNAIFSAQLADRSAGRLDAAGGRGGPVQLSRQPVNLDFVRPAIPFDEFDAWAPQAGARKAIQNGQQIFNRRPLVITGVAGLNDVVANPFVGSCATCHNVDHAGADLFPHPQRDLGIGGTASGAGGPLPAGDLPIFRLTCRADATPHPFRGRGPIDTNDPGLALLTGRCADIGRFTVPQLRALAAREPFFHDGSARTLADVVRFYEHRFRFDPPLDDRERSDLVAFLGAL